jgi:short-subunit dehydrogenase
MKDLRDKVALITGAASGIGRSLALHLAREGTHLYLLDKNEVGLNAVAEEARSQGIQVLVRPCDVSHLEEIEASINAGLAHWGIFDLLINNAGVAYYGDTAQLGGEHCEQLLRVNLHAPLHFTRLLLPTLLARPESHVLNVASFFGLIGTRKVAAYTASKFGLVGFSESLRAEYARTNLGVTALCPGFVDTGLFATASHGADRQSVKLPPTWMLTTPEKVAERAVRAIRRNEALVVTQRYARLAYYAKRFLPGVLDFANHLSRKRFDGKGAGELSSSEQRRAA